MKELTGALLEQLALVLIISLVLRVAFHWFSTRGESAAGARLERYFSLEPRKTWRLGWEMVVLMAAVKYLGAP